VLFAGSVKDDGSWGGNSLYNNKGFRKEMNQNAKKELRAKLKDGYGDVPCTEEQLAQVQKLFAQGRYKIVR
jgi:hypothetical protein